LFQNHDPIINAQDRHIEKAFKMQSFSYSKPHPPYLAPEPYNEMYHPDDVSLCVAGSSAEEEMAHQHP
jgi:hypothetical protein